ncbi:MAG: Eco57I restriction-modification methylase domain-containing protein, partial [Blastocatellia bacterium]
EPQPLPNLDFKIGCGDSLIAPAPNAPNAADTLLDVERGKLVQLYRRLKGEFMRCNDPQAKKQMRDQIETLRNEIAVALKHQTKRPSPQKILLARQQLEDLRKRGKQAVAAKNHAQAATLAKQHEKLKRQLAQWEQAPPDNQSDNQDRPFDWAVEFAEVFLPEVAETARYDGGFAFMDGVDRQLMFTDAQVADAGGGFDVVLANPPYVRMELFKEIKPILKRNFPEVHAERADLYIYFYDRALQLLKTSGVGCFISSNKWLRAGYGENLRRSLLDKEAFHLIVDFGDLPVFKASAYPAIFVWQKQHRSNYPTKLANIASLEACYAEGIREHVDRVALLIPATQFGKGKARLASSGHTNSSDSIETTGPRLREIITVPIGWGIKTGLNEAFIIDRSTSERLTREDTKSSEVIKPLLKGDDVRRYEIHFHEIYLIYLPHGSDIRRYPAIRRHLEPFRSKLENRATQQEWYELQQPQAAYVPFFNSPKIIFPDIAKEIRFSMDIKGFYSSNTTYFIPLADWYLLGVLNSSSVDGYFRKVSAEIRGGYLRFFGQYLENVPIPDAPTSDRELIAKLAQQTQNLHTKRRQRVEQFLRDLSISPAESSSRNPLEQPWALKPEEFAKRAKHAPLRLFQDARDETAALTEGITRIEREIDERVAELYGVPLDPNAPPRIAGAESEPRPFD